MATRILIGLGNPGDAYAETRHNLGFKVVDGVASVLGAALDRAGSVLAGEAWAGHVRAVLVKPMTYVNLSGEAVARVRERYGTMPEDLLVVVDDMSLEVGRIRVRRRGSDGGHNGLRSIIAALDTEAFPRIRIGIGPPPAVEVDSRDHVLGRFRPDEREVIERAVARAVEAAVRWIREDPIQEIMNRYNGKPARTRGAGGRTEPCSDGES